MHIFFKLIVLILNINHIITTCNIRQSSGVLKCEAESMQKNFGVYNNIKDKIKTFVCNNCDETELKNDMFPFKNIIEIEISNKINKLNTDALKDLNSLKKLNLNRNSIIRIPNDFFVPVKSIQLFNISHNMFRNPTTDTFYSLKSLKVLDLSHNKITVIELGVLDQMIELEELYLNNNGLDALELGILDELHKLKLIDLSYNYIKEIVLGLFDQSKNILELNLNGNEFKSILLGAYDSLGNVLKLQLSNCQIANIPLGMFDRNKKLQYLDLSLNKLTGLKSGMFDENLNLKYMNISHNLLRNLESKLFQKTSLEIIDLSYNNIETIPPVLLNLETLTHVYAQRNKIYVLDALTFSSVRYNLQYVNLSYNHLVYLDETFFEWLSNLEQFEIFGNPWDCKCLNALEKVLQKKFIQYSKIEFNQGDKPICVVGDINRCSDNHNLTVDDLKNYQNLFIK